MLYISGLRAGYGGGQVLHGVDLAVPHGTVAAVVGPNGAGKTTLLHAVAGLLPVTGGTVRLAGTVLSGQPAHRVARAGVALVPQGRRVFASLTVAEHFTLAGNGASEWGVPRVLDLFPRLAQRLRHRADRLSGGEQQMLAIARALLRQPRVLLLDEACEGLALDLAGRVRAAVAELARAGTTVLMVEQAPGSVRELARQVAALDHGRLTVVSPIFQEMS